MLLNNHSDYTSFSSVSLSSLWSYQEDHSVESIYIAGYWLLVFLVSFLCISTEPIKINVFIRRFYNHILPEEVNLPWWLRWSRICPQYWRPVFDPWIRKIPWRRKWQPTLVSLPGILHGWRNLASNSPWHWEESDTTEWLHFNQIWCLQVMHKQTESLCD